MSPLVLSPAMPSESGPPDWPGSVWIGAIDVDADVRDGVVLQEVEGYERARLLVRRGRTPLDFVEFQLHSGSLRLSELESAITRLAVDERPSPIDAPAAPISVVLCTRDRPEHLRAALASLLVLDYPSFEVVVVDNASVTASTQQVAASTGDPRVRVVREPVPGLARARNRGVVEAANDLVAFTDDDVIVDRQWLRGLNDAFASTYGVGCVCGIVPSGELRSYSQAYFDGRVTWARSCLPQTYRMSAPPAGQVLFPFQVGQYGTGANFALRRSVLLAIGGFDEGLGVGSPTRGGEDIDVFVRVLLAGHALVFEPSALIWHRHRADLTALSEQIVGYGVGLGAWVTKLVMSRRTAPMVMRRALRALAHVRSMARVNVDTRSDSTMPSSRRLAVTELRAALRGPAAYLKARRSGARAQPLRNAVWPRTP